MVALGKMLTLSGMCYAYLEQYFLHNVHNVISPGTLLTFAIFSSRSFLQPDTFIWQLQ